MRISDWSSDVCSSDLFAFGRSAPAGAALVALGDLLDGGLGAALGGAVGAGGHVEFHGLEALQLVAQAGGFLELEVGGGGANALLDLGDGGLEVVAEPRLVRGEARASGDAVAAPIPARQEVGDGFLDLLS